MTISQFKGTTMVNLREYYDDKGELKPGKKVSRQVHRGHCTALSTVGMIVEAFFVRASL